MRDDSRTVFFRSILSSALRLVVGYAAISTPSFHTRQPDAYGTRAAVAVDG